MKLAIDARYIGKSGIGSFIEGVLQNILESHKENSYLVILSDKNIILNYDNCEVLYTDIAPFTLKELFCFPVKEINKCDAFFTPYINIPYGIKVPIYSTIHDVIFLDIKDLVSKIGYIVRKLYIWRAIRMSKAIFTVSEFSKGRILHHFHVNKDIIVVYNGISKAVLNYKIQGEKKNYILFVGNVKRHKGIDILLKAYKEAKQQGFEFKLVIVGEYKNFRTSAHISDLLNDNDIFFTGHVSDSDLCKYISEAHRLVLPSRYEGFGIPPLEALYLGTEVLISDISVFKEIYKNLPVSYFQSESINDLTAKILKDKKNISDIIPLRKQINSLYSYSQVSKKIIKYINQNLG